MKFIATLQSVRKDSEGEVKVTFTVPKLQAGEVIAIPEETQLSITVEAVE